MRLNLTYAILPLLLLVTAFGTGCLGSAEVSLPPDQQFGHRFEGRAADGRETIVLDPTVNEAEFLVYPAVYDTLNVRVAPIAPDEQDVPVEVLIKGAFPDGCTTLHEVQQNRSGNIIEVDLTMRRPQGALCASVLRPYRFYLSLEGRFAPGPYTLKLNGDAHPFEIRAPLPAGNS